jgi:hypothetical protein
MMNPRAIEAGRDAIGADKDEGDTQSASTPPEGCLAWRRIQAGVLGAKGDALRSTRWSRQRAGCYTRRAPR